MRLVFAGTPQVAADTLAELLASDHHEVVAVLTRPDAAQGRSSRLMPSPVAQLAMDHGIEVLRPARARDPELADRLAELAPDCCPVVAYGGLIPAPLLAVPTHGWINVHFSLLPRWRGAAPVQHAIAAGDLIIGVMVFELVFEFDAGPILGQAIYPLDELTTAGVALAELQTLGAHLLLDTLAAIEAGTAISTDQTEIGVTVAPKLTVGAARLDWQRPARELQRQVLANNPSPVAWTTLDGQRFRIFLARAVEGPPLDPGQIHVEKRRVLVGTGHDALELIQVQPAGRKAVAGADWGRGLRGPGRFE